MPYVLSPGWLRIDPTFAPLKGNPPLERALAGTYPHSAPQLGAANKAAAEDGGRLRRTSDCRVVEMARGGIEPPTRGFSVRCSTI